jgi:hypothetical protein
MKNHSLRNHESENEIIRFYDEREWRYVPNLDIYKKELFKLGVSGGGVMTKKIFEDPELLAQANSIVEKAKLIFKPESIKYIIVKEEDEIFKMIKKLEDIKGDRYPANVIKILTSRIVTYDQIENDFLKKCI